MSDITLHVPLADKEEKLTGTCVCGPCARYVCPMIGNMQGTCVDIVLSMSCVGVVCHIHAHNKY